MKMSFHQNREVIEAMVVRVKWWILRHRTEIALALFFLFVLSYSLNDQIVHGDLYDHGLAFSRSWAEKYWTNYAIMFQLAIISLTLFCRNRWFFIFAETFTLTMTQDFAFFMWDGWRLPQGEWTWMQFYKWFGTWTTQLQILLSTVSLAVVLAAWYRSRHRRLSLEKMIKMFYRPGTAEQHLKAMETMQFKDLPQVPYPPKDGSDGVQEK